MNLLDCTFPTPAENLACDEALLEAAEAGECGEMLRFWEPRQLFVVVGYANKLATEVNLEACESRGVPVLRRCSGGGTVLQGPGCLNYAVVLRMEGFERLRTISAANRFIMERNRAAIEYCLSSRETISLGNTGVVPFPLLTPPKDGPDMAEGGSTLPAHEMQTASMVKHNVQTSRPHVSVEGHTDLTLAGRKFSGNSQRRRRRFLLFHGTFLLDFDLAQMETLLPLPSQQPHYRQGRSHRDFLVNLHLPAAMVKAALSNVWHVTTPLSEVPGQRIEALVKDKYSTRDWNFRF